ncbi:MAG: GTP-binding protein [Rhodospirillaceae bacterium]|nr:GTP-binding protein [Rhodospirillaceae bacterium]MYB11678.1 GTP-binding protein [Rhodospirillaceae bacterium]MYI49726.1 GTP-binding protein [Rhodospirillaceae bacterium]
MVHPRPAIPLTIVAGYLGSGKTSLLNHVIARCDTSRFAILVNDFGKLNIDAELVEMQGGRAYRLESGCICCSIGNSLTSTLLNVLRREPRPERILLESSGVADPARIADIARLSPSLLPGRVVVLVDSAQVRVRLADTLVGETVRKQIDAADLLILNKADLVTGDDLANLSDWLRLRFGERPHLAARHARIPVADVLADPAATLQGHSEAGLSKQHSEVFWSWSYEGDRLFRRRDLEAALTELAPLVERAKGFVRFRDAPERTMIVQLTGSGLSIAEAPQRAPEETKCRIEFVGAGKKPDETALRRPIERARDVPSFDTETVRCGGVPSVNDR